MPIKYDMEYLIKIKDLFLEEIEKCLQNGCYIAGLIMCGALLETCLLAICFCYPEKVRKTKIYKDIKKRFKEKRGLFFKLNLSQLIKIANELKWLPLKEEIDDLGTFEDFIRFVQEVRNLVHPARWMKPSSHHPEFPKILKETPYKDYKKYLKFCKEIVENTCLILGSVVAKDLEKYCKKIKK